MTLEMHVATNALHEELVHQLRAAADVNEQGPVRAQGSLVPFTGHLRQARTHAAPLAVRTPQSARALLIFPEGQLF